MYTKRILLIFFLSLSLVSVYDSKITSSHQISIQASDLQRESVSFCRLAKNPETYQGRMVQLKAVLAESQIEGLVHGDDPFLYDPRCRKLVAVVGWENSSDMNGPAYDDLKRIRKSVKGGYSRANVIVIGILSGYGKHKYGDRGWADLKFIIHEVERAQPVAANLPWPKLG